MKRIMVMDGQGANHYYRLAWAKAFQTAGHPVFFWSNDGKSAFDAFDEFKPDIFIGSTWQLDRSIIKNLVKRPEVKVILCADNWGDLQVDLEKYPVGVADDNQKRLAEELYKGSTGFRTVITQHNPSWAQKTHGKWAELGLSVHGLPLCADVTEYFPTDPNPAYVCAFAYCGNYWKYKAESTLDKYIVPILYPNTDWPVRLFGNGWSGVQSLGNIGSAELNKFYRNAGFVPSFGEGHSYDIYADLPQRFFQVPASMGFQIAPKIIGIEEHLSQFMNEILIVDSPSEFFDRVIYFLNNPDKTIPYRVNGCKKVFRNDTNFHRAAMLLAFIEEDNIHLHEIAKSNYDTVCKYLEQV